MALKNEVQQFLTDFFVKYKIFGILFRDFRQKNIKTLLSLEIQPSQRREIIERLTVANYAQGPLDDKLYGIASMWVFGTVVKGTEIYIKISLGAFSSPVICISFHDAEHPLHYPFKNLSK